MGGRPTFLFQTARYIFGDVTSLIWRSDTHCLKQLEMEKYSVQGTDDSMKLTSRDCNFILSKIWPFFTPPTKVQEVPSELASVWRLSITLVVESPTCHTSFGMKLCCQHIPCSANLLQTLSCTQSVNNTLTTQQWTTSVKMWTHQCQPSHLHVQCPWGTLQNLRVQHIWDYASCF